jgi:hypothetical protein
VTVKNEAIANAPLFTAVTNARSKGVVNAARCGCVLRRISAPSHFGHFPGGHCTVYINIAASLALFLGNPGEEPLRCRCRKTRSRRLQRLTEHQRQKDQKPCHRMQVLDSRNVGDSVGQKGNTMLFVALAKIRRLNRAFRR